MKLHIRRPAIAFALLSAIFWALSSDLGSSVRAMYAADRTHMPVYEDWLFNGLPAIVYAVACLLFCHWLARRVARQVAALPKD
ncbi:MAG: hypothetical protein ABIS51_18935 [Sphingomonas sp.]